MMKRHEIQVLLKAGLAHAEVARVAGVSERTVRSVQKEAAVTEVDDGAERRQGLRILRRLQQYFALLETTSPGICNGYMLWRSIEQLDAKRSFQRTEPAADRRAFHSQVSGAS